MLFITKKLTLSYISLKNILIFPRAWHLFKMIQLMNVLIIFGRSTIICRQTATHILVCTIGKKVMILSIIPDHVFLKFRVQIESKSRPFFISKRRIISFRCVLVSMLIAGNLVTFLRFGPFFVTDRLVDFVFVVQNIASRNKFLIDLFHV
jgi:ribosomal protein L31